MSHMGQTLPSSFSAGAGRCPLFPVSDQTAYTLQMTRRARSGHSNSVDSLIRSIANARLRVSNYAQTNRPSRIDAFS